MPLSNLCGYSATLSNLLPNRFCSPRAHPPAFAHHERSSNTFGAMHVYPKCAREGGSLSECFPDGNVPGAGQFPVAQPNTQAYDATCNSNLVQYWGQNSYGAVNSADTSKWQKTLSFYCGDDTTDAFPIAFVDQYFSTGGLPHLDMSNVCGAPSNGAFAGTNLANCQFLATDIKACQAKGKIVTISLGGATGGGSFTGDVQASAFADTIWNLFLGGSSSTRPFGSAVLDGVDLDIESGSSSYTAFVNKLRSYFATASKKYYITAAPQCAFPDAALSSTLNSAVFDAVYVQFYNNPCGLTHYSDGSYTWNFGVWDYWARNISPNRNVKVFIGAPANTGAAGSGYVPIASLQTIAQATRKNFPSFGGVMFWDASQSYANGRYDVATKAFLKNGGSCGGAYVYQACTAPAWSSAGSYPGGSTVSYGGYQWYARWWASGPPVGSDDNNAWRALFACSGSGGSTAVGSTTSKTTGSTSTTIVTTTKPATTTANSASTTTTTSKAATTTSAGGGCLGVSAWSASTSYTSGTQVTYSGSLWTAKQWSYNEVPGGASAAWTLSRSCITKRAAENDAELPRETERKMRFTKD